ncbi:MAG: class I SAM-dependent rRNA methyltransferase [Alphaproteobacteria bacterium]|nr:class I SAM-dependent rRNA methyltransferase [Alphaproteobacteria bacterium]
MNGYSTQWLDKGFPWVYRDELQGGDAVRDAGDVVRIVGQDGQGRGVGLWSDTGKVAVRRFRTDEGPLDAALIAARMDAARARRPLPDQTTAWRWVHGENDGLPGIRVDVWGPEVAIALDAPGLERLLPLVVDHVVATLRPTAVWRVDRLAHDVDLDARAGVLYGDPADEAVEVEELGLRYGVHPGRSQDVGLYCDMRDVRAWLRPHLAGRRVLNLFAHTGAFSVVAAAAGAAQVVTVDLSPGYLARAEDNFRRNGLDPAAHEFLSDDSLAVLDRMRRKGEQFDLVVADPPSFSHGPRGDWSVERDFARLVTACCRVLADNGWLLAASNHGGLSPKDFRGMVQQGSIKAGIPLRLLHEGSTPVDFPASLAVPTSRYLKCWVLSA